MSRASTSHELFAQLRKLIPNLPINTTSATIHLAVDEAARIELTMLAEAWGEPITKRFILVDEPSEPVDVTTLASAAKEFQFCKRGDA
jgi:hypothetical protein